MGRKPSRASAPRRVEDPKPTRDERWARFIALIEGGNTIRQIADMPGALPWETARVWMKSDPGKRAEYEDARRVASEVFEGEIIDKARSITDPAAAKVHIGTLQWILERRDVKRFGAKQSLEHTGADGAALQMPTLVIAPFQKPDDPDTD